jgi:hypothetical protein
MVGDQSFADVLEQVALDQIVPVKQYMIPFVSIFSINIKNEK